MRAVIELISRVRNIRTELSVKPGEYLPRLYVASPDSDMRHVFANATAEIARLTRASKIFVGDSLERFTPGANGGREAGASSLWLNALDPDDKGIPRASARAVLAGGGEVAVPLEGLIDFAQERARITREREKVEKELQKAEAQLANTQFVARAPTEKVEELRQRAAEFRQRTTALEQMLEALGE
jgi:valyl-tRNA synthetase